MYNGFQIKRRKQDQFQKFTFHLTLLNNQTFCTAIKTLVFYLAKNTIFLFCFSEPRKHQPTIALHKLHLL